MITISNYKPDKNYYLFFDVETTPVYFIQDNDLIETSTVLTKEQYDKYKAMNNKLIENKYKIGSYQMTKMISLFDQDNNSICFIVDDEHTKTDLEVLETENYITDIYYGDSDDEIIDMFWQTVDKYVYENINVRLFAHNIGFDCKQVKFFEKIINFKGKGLSDKFYKSVKDSKVSYSVNDKGKKISDKLICACLDKPFFIRLQYDYDCLLQLDDSYSFFAMPLKSLGTDLKIPKLEYDFSSGETLEINDITIHYCVNDSYIIKEAIIRLKDLLESKELGTLGVTLSGTAMNIWRSSFLEYSIDNSYKKADNPQTIIDIERQCYYGGRNECRAIGLFKNVYYYDINSLYPYVMEKFKFPTQFRNHFINAEGFSKTHINDCLKNENMYYIFKCEIDTVKPHIPIRGERFMFVNGKHELYMHKPEFLYFWNRNEVLKVTEILYYDCDSIFTSYINFFKKMKIENDDNPTYRLLAKLLQNVLYGKTAEHKRESDFFDVDKDNPLVERIITEELIDGQYKEVGHVDYFGFIGMETKDFPNENAKTAFPAIAGAVTSYARMELLNMMETLGLENILYYDTDSLISKVKMNSKFIHENEYGKWKNEAEKLYKKNNLPFKESLDVLIKGCKNYIVMDIENDKILSIKSKGIKRDSEEIDDDTYATTKWWTVKTSKVKKESLFTLNHTVIMYEIKKNTLEYMKGKTILTGKKQIKIEGITIKYNERKITPYNIDELLKMEKEDDNNIMEFIS